MRRPPSRHEPLTLEERERDTRDAMEWRELCAVEIGERVTVPDRPRRATLRRWLADPDFRERYAAAVESYKMSVVEAAIEQADRDVEHMHGRRRIAAMRRQAVARTQWLKLIDASAANDDAPDGRAPRPFGKPDGRVAPRPVLKAPRGISDEGVAILENAAERLASAAPSNDARANDSASSSARSPRHSRESGSPESQTEEARAETLDSRLRGNDETELQAALNDDADDDLQYAVEDLRYRKARREKESVADASPLAPEPAPPAADPTPPAELAPIESLLPPVELYEDGEPRFHRLPLTIGEEEALRARLAGKPLPVEEKKSPWKPDGPTYVRFDVGGVEASNQRDQGTGWDDYDPFAR